jgi:hypothetical protein
LRPMARLERHAEVNQSIRRGDALTAQRALRTLYQHDPSSTWRRLLIIACEDVGIGALGAVVMTAARCANAKALCEKGSEETTALATTQVGRFDAAHSTRIWIFISPRRLAEPTVQ